MESVCIKYIYIYTYIHVHESFSKKEMTGKVWEKEKKSSKESINPFATSPL